MTVGMLSPWQDPDDGYPTSGYFVAVIDELGANGIELVDRLLEQLPPVRQSTAEDEAGES